MMSILLRFICGGLLLLSLAPAATLANPIRADHITVQLIAETEQVQAGQAFWVGLWFQPDEHWHTYWRNPGDSGTAPAVTWQLPDGAQASDLHWPYPERIPVQHLMNFGYKDSSVLLVQITPPATLSEDHFQFTAETSWLVCEEICIPGDARLTLDLPVIRTTPNIDQRWQGLFSQTRAVLPKKIDSDTARVEVNADSVRFSFETPAFNWQNVQQVSVFPTPSELIKNAVPQAAMWQGQQVWISVPRSAYFNQLPSAFEAVLVRQLSDGSSDALQFNLQAGAVAWPEPFQSQQQDRVSASLSQHAAAPNSPSLWLALLLAFSGGMLLNLMPCVFPVLSLKALSLAKSNQLSRAQARTQGVLYSLGVLLSFAVIGGGLLALRASGEGIGWGFQLQEPIFVAAMAYLFFAMALSLSGVVQFGTQLMGMGSNLTTGGGYRGAFFTGVLATLVASPCTAPFMGGALGFAITQPAVVALSIFLALGAGMAAPFLLLAWWPALTRRLPKAGAWMETFKQIMAFPLYGTVIWLLWVLGRQTDANGMALVLCGLLLLAFALWLWQRSQVMSRLWQRISWGILVICLLLSLGVLRSSLLSPLPKGELAAAELQHWQAFTPERLAQLRAEGRAVFVNMTADWCITCLLNEQTTLNTQAVQQAFISQDIAYLKGDWTQRDEQITDFLAQFGRNGVPLYVYYPADAQQAPQVLPQLLTPDTVLGVVGKW